MFMHNFRIPKKMSEFFKFSTRRKKILLNNNNQNNKKNNMLIKTGHYQTVNSLNSDSPEIIRILGPDPKREDNWITQDGKSLPSYVIESEYVLLDTVPNLDSVKTLPVSIFAGMDELMGVTPTNNIEEEAFLIEEPVLIKSVASPLIQTKVVETQKQAIQQTIPHDISVIENISIDSLNKKHFTKFGEQNKYHKPVISVELEIELDYDIDKLRNSIELLDLDENIIINYLIDKISINSIRPKLRERLKSLILNNIDTSAFAYEKQEIKNLEQTIIKQEIIEKKIETPILEINSHDIDFQREMNEVKEYLSKTFEK